MIDLESKQKVWAYQLPLFKENYILTSDLDLLEFDMINGQFDIKPNQGNDGFDDEDSLVLYHSVNTAWAMWLRCNRLNQAEIEALKAQQKLNKPARIGGTVFREGVAWETVIECAQRHYDYGQRDTQPTPLISPSDAIKLASGELVLVPKEPTEAMIKHAYGTYEGATILPYSFYKAMIEAAQENSHE